MKLKPILALLLLLSVPLWIYLRGEETTADVAGLSGAQASHEGAVGTASAGTRALHEFGEEAGDSPRRNQGATERVQAGWTARGRLVAPIGLPADEEFSLLAEPVDGGPPIDVHLNADRTFQLQLAEEVKCVSFLLNGRYAYLKKKVYAQRPKDLQEVPEVSLEPELGSWVSIELQGAEGLQGIDAQQYEVVLQGSSGMAITQADDPRVLQSPSGCDFFLGDQGGAHRALHASRLALFSRRTPSASGPLARWCALRGSCASGRR